MIQVPPSSAEAAGQINDRNGGAKGNSGLACLAMDLAMPKAALQEPPPPPPASALAAAAAEAAGAGEAVAAMSAKAPPPLAAALGFFDSSSSSQGPSQDGAAAGGCAAATYQKVPTAPNAVSRTGKGPFDKGGGGKGEKAARPLGGMGMLVPPPPSAPVIVPPAACGGPPLGKGGKYGGCGWMPSAGMPGGGGKGCGPRIVLPPALTSPNTAIGPDPGEQPESLPPETDHDAWLELLRDGFGQQFRCENDWQEPPPFHRALHFASVPGESCPKGKFPREALNLQLQLLFKARTGMTSEADGPPGAAVASNWAVGAQ